MPTYAQSTVPSEFQGGGTAQGWTNDDDFWQLDLPFEFPFYDQKHATAYVSSNGFITFGQGEAWWDELPNMRGIFPYAADLYARNDTGGFDQDIRVASSASEVRVNWDTETFWGPGTTDYWYHTGSSWTPAGGTARGWKDDDEFWELALPFSFPFFGEEHQTAYVGSNGYLTFGAGDTTYAPALSSMKSIQAFGKDLITDCSDTDIYTDLSAAVAKIRWQARTYSGGCSSGKKVNFEIDLYPDGLVKVGYGLIEDSGSSQVVGISKGDGVHSVTSSKDHQVLANGPPLGASSSPEDVYEPDGGWPVNFEVVLKPSGEIRFRYGEMQDRNDFGQVGISRGDGVNYQAIAGYDGVQIPSGAQTVVLARQAAASGPAISGYAAAPASISPNGDGTNDTTTVSGSWDRYATWSLAIKNGAGATVRSYSGSGTALSQAWDGKDASGATVADGTYTASLAATDIDGLQSSQDATVVVDGQAPQVSGPTASPAAFSPNADGTKDTTTVSATVSDATAPIDWTLGIKNAAGSTVRTYSGSGTSVSQAWDGKNASGTVQPNGTYTASLTAVDGAGNSRTATTTVALDTAPPSISSYQTSNASFSPNGDDAKDTTTLSATLADSSTPISWSLGVKNSGGLTVRSYSGTGTSVSQAWDGRNDSGLVVADGTYTAVLSATDDAGNAGSGSASIAVDTVAPTVVASSASPNPFSPNANGVQDSTTFRATFSASGPWTLVVRDSSGATVRSFAGSGASVSQLWDGKNASGTVVPDGTYTATATISDAADNAASQAINVAVVNVGSRVIEQHWEVLSESATFASNGVIQLKRGALPAARTKLDPEPAPSFEVVGRVVGASGTARWKVKLLQASTSQIAEVTLGPGDASFGIKTASLLWPSLTDVPLDQIQVQVDKGSDPSSLTGTLELKKAYVKLAQDGVIKKTLGRVHLANKEAAIASDSWDWPEDRIIFKMPSAAYDPAPAVRLRATAAVGPLGGTGLVRLFDATTNTAVAGSEVSFTDANPISKETGALTLVGGRTYELNVAVLSAGQTFDLLNADLLFEQTTSDENGIPKTVGYFAGVSAPTSWTSSGTDLNSLLNAPRGKATSLAARWFATARFEQGAPSGSLRLDLRDRTAGTTLLQSETTSSGGYRLLEAASPATTLPAAGDDLDSRGISGAAESGRVSGSLLRVDYELIDVAGPAASLLENPAYFSPNGDGVQDTTTLTASMSDPSPPITWTIAIKNGAGDVVRSFSGQGTQAQVTWDGKNTAGAVVVDGTYIAELTAADSFGNQTVRQRQLHVDTQAPAISDYQVSPNPFSPNGDGDRDTTTFSATLGDDVATSVGWTLSIKNSSGTTVRSFSAETSVGTTSRTWDGKNSSGSTVADGEYTGTLSVSDWAGNKVSDSKTVTVDGTPPGLESFLASLPSFSPNGDGVKDTTTFSADISDFSSVTWTLALIDTDSVTVRSFSGSGKTVSQSWDGTDASGAVVPEGNYTAVLSAVDAVNNNEEATESVEIDIVAPRALGFEAYPNPFSPDSEPPRNATTVSTTLSEPLDWTLRIVGDGGSGSTVATTNGSGTDISYEWNGLDETGDPVVDGVYKTMVDAADTAGNTVSEFVYIHVGSGPTIASAAPPQAQIGDEIIIAGAGFGAEPIGEHGVIIGDEAATIVSWSDTTITASVPTSLPAGTHEVTVWQADMTSFPVEIEIVNYVLPRSVGEMNLGLINFRVRSGASAAGVTSRLGDPAPEAIFPDTTDADLARWYQVNIVSLEDVQDTADKIRQYAGDPDVEWAEFDPAPPEPTVIPDDDYFGQQWGLRQSSDVDIDAQAAWDVSKSSTAVKIAIIDSGIGPHADLDGHIVGGRDYTGSENTDDGCTRSFSHGTHVAGIASAVTNNSRGVAGVGWNAKLVPYKIFRDTYVASRSRYECRGANFKGGWARAVEDATRDGVHVVNMSFGAFHRSVGVQQDAITKAWKKGVVVVAAAGNDDSTRMPYPAGYKHVISVGAIDREGDRARWTDVDQGSNYGSWVDTFAPGDEILSTVVKATNAESTFCPNVSAGATYCEQRGTSMAAPFVAGTAALLRHLNDYNVSIAAAITGSEEGEGSGRPRHINANDAIAELQATMNSVSMPDGAFVKDKRSDHPTIYFVNDGERRRVRSSRILASWGLTASSPQIVRMEPKKLQSLDKGSDLGFRPGTTISPSVDPVEQSLLTYAVTNDGSGTNSARWTRGAKRRVPPASLACLGYRADRVRSVPQSEADLHATGTEVSGCEYPNGAIFGASGKLFFLDAGKRREMKGQVAATWGMVGDEARSDVSTALSKRDYPDGALLGYRPGTLIRTSPQNPLYFIAAEGSDFGLGKRRIVINGITGTAFTKCYRFSSKAVITSNDGVITSHVLGSDLYC